MFGKLLASVSTVSDCFLAINLDQLKAVLSDIYQTASSNDIHNCAILILEKTYGIPKLLQIIENNIHEQNLIDNKTDVGVFRHYLATLDFSLVLDEIVSEKYSALSFSAKRILYIITIKMPQGITRLQIASFFRYYTDDAITQVVTILKENHWIEVNDQAQMQVSPLAQLPNKIVKFFSAFVDEIERTSVKMEHVFARLPVGLAIFNKQGELEFVNDTHTAIMGGRPTTNSQNWWYGNIHPEDAGLFAESLKNLLKTYQVQQTIVRFVKTSEVTWALSQMAYEPHTDRVIGVLTDMSQQRKIESELREAQAWMRTQSMLSPAGICRMDAKGFLVWANDKWLRMSGFSSFQEAYDFQWKEAIIDGEKAASEWQLYVKKVRENPAYDFSPFSMEQTFLHADGTKVEVLAQASPVLQEIDGRLMIISFIGAVTDITELKQAYQTISNRESQLKVQAEFYRQEADHLLHNVCHTYKNQLQGLKMCIEMLSSMVNEKTLLAEVNSENNLVANLLNDLYKIYSVLESITLFELDIFKLKAGIVALESVPIDFKTIKKWLDCVYQVIAHKKGLLFSCKIEGGRFIKSDLKRLEVLLSNLLDNAIKYTTVGQVTILLQAKEEKHQLVFEISDTGIGISSGFIDSGEIYKQFTRESRDSTGYGLGLPACKAIVDAMQGSIEIKSVLGKGSVFIVKLPYEIPSILEIEVLHSKSSPASATDEVCSFFSSVMPKAVDVALKPASDKPLEGLKILVVEDSTMNRKLYKNFLQRGGAETFHAENGLEAIQKWDSTFDVIWMDIQMPVMSGIEATEILRKIFTTVKKHDPQLKIPLIIASSANPLQQHNEFIQLFDGYIVKPYSSQDMIMLITQKLQEKFPSSACQFEAKPQ